VSGLFGKRALQQYVSFAKESSVGSKNNRQLLIFVRPLHKHLYIHIYVGIHMHVGMRPKKQKMAGILIPKSRNLVLFFFWFEFLSRFEPLPQVVEKVTAGDLTTKMLVRMRDGMEIETVIIPHDSRPTAQKSLTGETAARSTLCVSRCEIL